jgi:hypothetical protein
MTLVVTSLRHNGKRGWDTFEEEEKAFQAAAAVDGIALVARIRGGGEPVAFRDGVQLSGDDVVAVELELEARAGSI